MDPVTVPNSESSDVASPPTILPILAIQRGHRSWLLVGVVTVVLVGLLGLFGYGLIKASTFAGIGINSVGEGNYPGQLGYTVAGIRGVPAKA